jgi:tyrosinase
MVLQRKDVWKLATWSDPMLWYARAVQAMQDRPLCHRMSWKFLAAMHGFNVVLWTNAHQFKTGDRRPSPTEEKRYWSQCQHGSWYFLPWHRAYLRSFELIVRAEIERLGGPQNWTLPYWRYDDKDPQTLCPPPAFRELTLPCGAANPLYDKTRAWIHAGSLDFKKFLGEDNFAGDESGANPSMGGPANGFMHNGKYSGLLEENPHMIVHGEVGRGGLLSNPETAALDPLFWLHHANIDRLWVIWLRHEQGRDNPTLPAWLDGGKDTFATFGPDGKDLPSTPRDVIDLAKLGYEYEDLTDPFPGYNRRRERLSHLPPVPPQNLMAAPEPPDVEPMGSTHAEVGLTGPEITIPVNLVKEVVDRFSASYTVPMSPGSHKEPDRVYLNLEHVRGDDDSVVLRVFIGAVGVDWQDMGVLSLFGVWQACNDRGVHGGQGLTKVLEITDFFDTLRRKNVPVPLALTVRLVPLTPVDASAQTRVGQVTILRRSA